MVSFALIGCFVVPVDALCNRTVSWNDYAAGSTFTTANVGGGVTMTLSPAAFSGGSDPLVDNHIVQTGYSWQCSYVCPETNHRRWSEYHIHLLCSNLQLVIFHH